MIAFWTKINFRLACLVLASLLIACQKEEVTTDSNLEWIRILEDNAITSTDDEMKAGQNAKVVTYADDKIALYYYSDRLKQTTVVRCDANGNPQWRETLPNFEPFDIVSLNGGGLVLVGDDPPKAEFGIKLYRFTAEGAKDSLKLFPSPGFTSQYEENACIIALSDNSVVLSGSAAWASLGSTLFNENFFAKISPSFTLDWKVDFSTHNPPALIDDFNTYEMQNSIIETNNGQLLFQYAIEQNPAITDEVYFGLLTGLMSASGELINANYYQTGSYVQTTNQREGHQNRYCKGLLADGQGGFIYHYSNPLVFGQEPEIPAGFLQLDANGRIQDTVAIPLPKDYHIVSCQVNRGQFLLTAYRTNVIDGTADFMAEQTLFLTGGADLKTSKTFSVQNLYADFFSSIAPTSDGSFIALGKVQTFNGSSNNVALVKISP
jgi:hypothetical protein